MVVMMGCQFTFRSLTTPVQEKIHSKKTERFLLICTDIQFHDELNELFMSALENIHRNLKKAHTGLKMLRRVAGAIPAIAFLELLILQKESSDKY